MECEEIVTRARVAMQQIAQWDQAQIDQIVRAVAWAIYRPDNARTLAEIAVRDTGMGNVSDKITKNQRKTLGTLRDLLRTPTVGCIDRDPAAGLVTFGKPVGVVAAITPSTNPAATPANKTMMALKGANAIVIAASPSGWTTAKAYADFARAELDMIGAPADLVQILPQPVSIARTEALMESADLVVVTGAQHNVRSAYRSGTPAIGVGAGNVPVIVDSSANLRDAAAKIASSKTFDNSTSCSAENSLVIIDDVYDEMLEALGESGGYRATSAETHAVRSTLFSNGTVDRSLIGQDLSVLAAAFGIDAAASHRFVMVELDSADATDPMVGEKLSLVVSIFRASNFDDALDIVERVLDVQGKGHSAGLHSFDEGHAELMADRLPVVRVLVNQAHAVGNGGSFDNSMPFTLSMGCGTWQGNSISENLNVSHFINKTFLVETIPPNEPTEESLFGPLLTQRESAATRVLTS